MLAAPVVADGVAVAPVPLRPQRREVAHLVPALAHVPRLGDELRLGDHRVLLDDVEERGEPVDVVQGAGERRREVEAEAVDVHLDDPVPEAVHHELQHVRVPHVQRVAGARVVHVEARLVGHQPVVRLVVDPLEREHRPEVVALGGVVVDDVEDHLDPRGVEHLDQLLELLHLLAVGPRGAVLAVGREVRDRVVAPVVAQAALEQHGVVHELVHRLQLDGGDAEPDEVVDDFRRGETGVGAAELGRHRRVARREPLHVQLVDERLVPRGLRRPVVAPVEERVGDHVLRHVPRAVGGAGTRLVAHPVREDRGAVVPDLAVHRLAVRVEQELGRIGPLAVRGRPRAVDAEAVALPGRDAAQVPVMDVGAALGSS